MTSGVQVPSNVLDACQLRKLASIDVIDIYVRDPVQMYGYFEFVHVPGAVIGDLKGIREAVSKSTRMFSYNTVLVINPSGHQDSAPYKIVSSSHANSSFLTRFLPSDVFVTEWFVNTESVQEESFYGKLRSAQQSKRIMSKVVREEFGQARYSAEVHVVQRTGEKVGDPRFLKTCQTYYEE